MNLKRDTFTNNGVCSKKIINFYAQLIIQRHKDNPKEFADVHVYNTFFYDTLSKFGYNKVRKWSKKFDTFKKDLIIIPVHLGMHWVCAAINLRRKRFEYYDSLHGGPGRCFQILRDYLKEESKDKKKEDRDLLDWTEFCPKVDLFFTSFIGRATYRHDSQDIPAQQNGYDCGVFTCMFMDYLARQEDFDFSQDNMPYLRERIIWEISQSKMIISSLH